jgi:predicted metal-dependent hydrolase
MSAQGPIVEPPLSPEQRRDYDEGWSLFAAGHYWHAHEAWERLWRPFTGPARPFVQGLIQLTAACHLLLQPSRLDGALRNLVKAADKLAPFADRPSFLGVDVSALLLAMAGVKGQAAGGARLDHEGLGTLAKTFRSATVGDPEDQT